MSENDIINFDYALDHYIVKTRSNNLAMAGSLRIFGITGLLNVHTPLTLISNPPELVSNVGKVSCSDKIIGIITRDKKIFIAVNDLLRPVYGFEKPGFNEVSLPRLQHMEAITKIFCTNHAIFIVTNLNNIYSRGFDNGQFGSEYVEGTSVLKVQNSSMSEFKQLNTHTEIKSIQQNTIIKITSIDNYTYILTEKQKLYVYLRDVMGKKIQGKMYKISNDVKSISKGYKYSIYALINNKIYAITGESITLHADVNYGVANKIEYGPIVLTDENRVFNSGENRFGRIGYGVADNELYKMAEITEIYDNDNKLNLADVGKIRFVGSTQYISYIVTLKKVYITGTSILTEEIKRIKTSSDEPNEKIFMYFNAYFPTFSDDYTGLDRQSNDGLESLELPLENTYELSSENGPNGERSVLVRKREEDDEEFYYDT